MSINLEYTNFNLLLKIAISLIFFIISYLMRKKISKILAKIFNKITSKTAAKFDDTIASKIIEPLNFLYILSIAYISFIILPLNSEYHIKIDNLFITISYIGFSWILFIFIDVISESFGHKIDNRDGKVRLEIINFVIKILKTVIFIIAFIVILKTWGYDVSAIIASLGIGGLAFALAAKDTIANLFGSMVILWDTPFKHGDWIKVENIEGTVIEIGMRSTTIRTFDNALVTVPNATLANQTIKNWSNREVGRRIKFRIGLVYQTSPKQLKDIVSDIHIMLKSHPKISKKNIENSSKFISSADKKGIKSNLLVFVDRFNDSSIDILIYCFSTTIIWREWLEVKEDIILKIMDIVKNNGSDFAYPTQTLFLEH